jgi:hypothetical protein
VVPEHFTSLKPALTRADVFGATDTARKTNYDFERRERERSKAADSAKKAQAKADKKAGEQGTPDRSETGEAEAD